MSATKKLTFLILVTLCTGLFPVVSAREVNAQWLVSDPPVEAATAATVTAVTTAASNELIQKAIQTQTIGLVYLNNAADQAALAGIKSTTSVCDGIDQAEQVASTADQLNNFSLIGGGAAYAGVLAAKITALETMMNCYQAQISAVDALIPVSVAGAESYTKKQIELSAKLNQAKIRHEDLKKQQTAEIKDVLKAIMVRIILTVSKNLTTEMVNKMVEKYKIQDYLAYGDALTSQVYSMKYINENFSGDARQQMMIRSLLQSEKFPEKVKTVQAFANSKAQEYLGTACGVGAGADPNNPNDFMKCLAAYGAPQSSPEYHVLQAASQAQAAMASAHNTTAAEIAQSDGYAPPRNCQGSIAQQKQIDDQYDQVYAERDIAIGAAAKLEIALNQKPPKTTKEEYDKAQAAADQAIANAESLDEKGDPIIDICEAIDSPAKFVSESIGKFLEKNLVQDTDLKTDNLPFYATFLSDVASNFLTNILTGGKSTSQVLKEAGVGALNGTLMAVNSQSTGVGTGVGANTNSQVKIVAYELGIENAQPLTTLTAGKHYRLVADFSQISGSNPYRMVITGFNAGPQSITLSQSQLNDQRFERDIDVSTGSFTVGLTFYARNSSGDGEISLGTYQQYFSVSQVNGAITLLPRGPAR